MLDAIRVAQIALESAPEEGRDAAKAINQCLEAMDIWAREFRSALTLFDFCEAQMFSHLRTDSPQDTYDAASRAVGWQFVAARDGAMSIYHFAVAMEGVKLALHAYAPMKDRVDNAAIRAVTKRFARDFPSYEAMRHAIAHSAELTMTTRKLDKNALKGSYSGPGLRLETAENKVFIRNGLQNRIFTTTREGHVLTYPVTEETLRRLAVIRDQFYAALSAITVARD